MSIKVMLQVTSQGHLLVKDLQSWMDTLIFLSNTNGYLLVSDPDTGARYQIKREESLDPTHPGKCPENCKCAMAELAKHSPPEDL